VRIELRPCVRRLASPHPVLSIWEANQEGRDGTPARAEGGERVVVRRDAALQVVPAQVSEGAWALLEAFAGALALSRAAERCERQGWAFDAALRELARLDVLGGFGIGGGP
jgi:hypothetical protein